MQIDKDTILQLLRQSGENQKADAASQQLPGQVDTDNQDHLQLLSRLGINLDQLKGLLDKMPGDLKDKLPGGIGKLLGG